MESTAEQQTTNGNGQWVDPVSRVASLLEQNETEQREAFTDRPDVETGEQAPPPDSVDDQPDANPSPESDESGLTDAESPETAGESETEPESGSQADGEGESDPDQSELGEIESLDLHALAQKLDIPLDDLYALEIPLGGEREPITLGQFKDRVQDLFTVEERRESLDAARIEHENEVLRDRNELLAMIRESGTELTPELRQRAAAAAQQHASEQRELLLSVLPGWRENDTYQRDRASMVDTLGREYGLTEAQIGSQVDAVIIKMMHDLTQFHTMFSEAKAAGKRIPKAPRKPGKPRAPGRRAPKTDEIIAAGKATNDPFEKAGAVGALLASRKR